MIDARNSFDTTESKIAQITRICKPPFIVGLVGAAVFELCMGFAHAVAYAEGAFLVAGALLLSAVMYLRVVIVQPGLNLFRLFTALAVKWTIVIGGAVYALSKGVVVPEAFLAGMVLALVSTFIGFSGKK